jgi:hypothetical protein
VIKRNVSGPDFTGHSRIFVQMEQLHLSVPALIFTSASKRIAPQRQLPE